MTLKFWRLLLIYTLAAIIALTGYAFAAHRQLDRLRLTAGLNPPAPLRPPSAPPRV